MLITDHSLFSQWGFRDWEINYTNPKAVGSNLDNAQVQRLFSPMLGINANNLPLETHISDLGRLRLAFETFLTQLQAIGGNQQTLISNAPDVAQVTHSNHDDGSAGILTVVQLAQQQQAISAIYADHDNTRLGTGQLIIQQGEWNENTASFTPERYRTVNISVGTLDDIIFQINQADAGITAQLISLDQGYQLGLAATQSGTHAAFALAVLDEDGDNTGQGGLSQLFYRPPAGGYLYTTALAQDSQILWHGEPYHSADVDIATLANALGFRLSRTGETRIGNLQDHTLFNYGVSNLLDGYNHFIENTNQLTSQALADGYRQPFANIVDKLAIGYPGQHLSLADLGISRQSNQQLTLDNQRLTSSYQQHRSDSYALLSKAIQLVTQASTQGLQLTEASLEIVDARQTQNPRLQYMGQLLRDIPLFPDNHTRTGLERSRTTNTALTSNDTTTVNQRPSNPSTTKNNAPSSLRSSATSTSNSNASPARLMATTKQALPLLSEPEQTHWLSTRFPPRRTPAQAQMYAAMQLQHFFTAFEQAMSAVA